MQLAKRSSIGWTLILLICWSATALAAPVIVGLSADIRHDAATASDGFHVEGTIDSESGVLPICTDLIVSGHASTGTWSIHGLTLTPIGPETYAMTLDLETSGTIQLGQWLHFGMEFEVGSYNTIRDLRGWWALGGTLQDEAPLTGFWADDLEVIRVGYQTLRILNDTSLDIDLPDLDVAISAAQIPLEDMDIADLGKPGEVSPSYPGLTWIPITGYPGTVPAGSSFDVHLEDFSVTIPPEQFLLIRGQQLTDGAPTGDWNYFWEQHEANPAATPTPVPTSTPDVPTTGPTGLLLLLGLVSLLLRRRRG